MHITRAGEYGVLGLMNLARRAPGQMAMIEEVSRAERIPKSFLAKIFQELARGGLVRSNRGAGGGFALARRPSQITVLEIIEAIEGKILFQRCKLAKPDCEHPGGCALCGLYEQAQDGVKDVFSRTTLRALVHQQEIAAAAPRRARRPRRRRPPACAPASRP
jgi:Rrf2 family protein